MQECEWLCLDGTSTRLFRLGERIRAGQLVGRSASGRPVRALFGGQIVGIEYDVENDSVRLQTAYMLVAV